MTLGPVMIDLEGTSLSAEEKEMIAHPMVGGLIFFTRNFESRQQIHQLTREIKKIRNILVCVDHEGGRVQRFREGFTRLPPCAVLGETYDKNPQKAMSDAHALGWLMAAELIAVQIDFSFAPVLDVDYRLCDVIGNRAFHSDPEIIGKLASSYVKGMADAGMSSTGKHFPGHGAVKEDSHLELPVDGRSLKEIMNNDVIPFRRLNESNLLDAVMPAHVIYDQIDKMPAGFSSVWIKQILREQLHFNGVVFSDDLNMAAAGMAGSFTDRAEAAMKAGCDMILVCNNRAGAIEVLEHFNWQTERLSIERLEGMFAKKITNEIDLKTSDKWQDAVAIAESYM
ncbi:MAG: beta-N-acetylhexosaminidase [Gammaproteobacteria bacterium]|nr:beta-N-acetylhexosaminidase [Gammaproteobacteria bacterium]